MNRQDFIALLQHPQHITEKQANDIQEILVQYPYFQSARALHLKALKNKGSFKYNQELKITAAQTTDRSILFDYITSEVFNQNEISNIIKQNSDHLKDIQVNELDDISVKKSVKIDDALKEQLKAAENILDPNLFKERLTIGTISNFHLEGEPSPSEQSPEPTDNNPEGILKIGKPLDFDRSEKHSFAEWLKITSFKPIIRDEDKDETMEDNTSVEKKFELIDKFLEANPKIVPSNDIPTHNIAKAQAPQNDGLMTETLARIFLEQKNYDKAIQSYKILSLKYPEKSGFFADQIKAVKQLQEKNNI